MLPRLAALVAITIGLLAVVLPGSAAAFPTVASLLTLPAGDEQALSIAVTPDGAYAYIGLDFPTSGIVKVRTSDMTKVGTTLVVDANAVRGIAIDPSGTYAYAAINGGGKLVRIRLSDFTAVETLTISGGPQLSAVVVDAAGAFAYVTTYQAPSKVIKIDLATFTAAGQVTLGSGDNLATTPVLSSDGAVLFAATQTGPARVVRIRTSDLVKTHSYTFPAGRIDAMGLRLDPTETKIYVSTGGANGYVTRLDAATLTNPQPTTTSFSGGGNGVSVLLTTTDGTRAFTAPSLSNGAPLYPVDLSTMIIDAPVDMGASANWAQAATQEPSGIWGYVAMRQGPSKVAKIQLAAARTLTVTREGDGTVSSDRGAIACGSTCAADYGDGTAVTLTAAAAAGSAFTGWGGACSGTATTCTVTMSAARTVSATFTATPSSATATSSTPASNPTASTRATGTVTASKPRFTRKSGRMTMRTTVNVSGAGSLVQRAVATIGGRSTTLCTVRATTTAAGSRKLACRFSRAASRAARSRSLSATITTTFTPAGGDAVSATQTAVVRKSAPTRR